MPMHQLVVPAVLFFALSVLGCSTSPTPVPSGSSTASEGSSEPASARPESSDLATAFGGEYKSPELASYVTEVGKRVAAKSEHPDPPYTFTVLDTPIVNAFAGSNGDIYVTRGLLALANNESQLAGVLGHEIGHAIAARQAQPQTAESAAQSSSAGELPATRGMDLPALKFITPFTNDAESQVAQIGLKCTTGAGYDPQAFVPMLASIDQYQRLTNQTFRRKPDYVSPFDFLATHAHAIDIYNRAAAQSPKRAGSTAPNQRDAYITHINGMLYGESADVGFVNGILYENPKLQLRLYFPKEYELFPTKDRVYAVGPKNALIVLDRAPESPNGPLKDYITNVWAKGPALRNVRSGHKGSLEAASAITTVPTPHGLMNLDLFVIRVDPTHVYRLRGEYSAEMRAQGEYAFLKTMVSFKPLSDEKANALKERRTNIVDVRAGDSLQSLAKRSAMPEFNLATPGDLKIEFFRMLNGLGAKDSITIGQKVKLVVQ